jgi:site-specific DNA-methyltransferase (adenine-specific)
MIICGDCLAEMARMDANSIDAVICDPPYGLEFMGKEWDHGIPGVHFWVEALRVAKPGCHLLAFGGTRTFHRLACAIEDAVGEIRDAGDDAGVEEDLSGAMSGFEDFVHRETNA